MRYKKFALVNSRAIVADSEFNTLPLVQEVLNEAVKLREKEKLLTALAQALKSANLATKNPVFDDLLKVETAKASAVEAEKLAIKLGLTDIARRAAKVRDSLARIEKKLKTKG